LNFNDIIEETVKLLPPSGYLLSKKLGNIPNIVGVKEDLIGVLINLINNAKRAMPDGGTLTLKTRFDENTNTVIAQISDTGIGIPSKNLESIWKPYFTTDKTDGHGLGLSIAQKTIQEHQGLIQVESEQGKGTTFILKFPITA
jgi:signal transduction histidine kinase